MNHKELSKTLQPTADELAKSMGLEVVKVNSKVQNGKHTIEVLLYGESGLTIDQCAEFNRKFGEQLDNLDVIQKEYNLEVASPGLDWPLKTDDDLRRVKGKILEAKLYGSMDGKKMIKGKLLDYNEKLIILEEQSPEEIKIEIERDKIARLTQAIFI